MLHQMEGNQIKIEMQSGFSRGLDFSVHILAALPRSFDILTPREMVIHLWIGYKSRLSIVGVQ